MYQQQLGCQIFLLKVENLVIKLPTLLEGEELTIWLELTTEQHHVLPQN